MHIPDGYLSPTTAGALYAASAPFWYLAGRKTRAMLSGRLVPLMALLSAFCFVIQMINIPLPGGTTGHAVGASLAAIVLTPWPAIVAVTIALIIQAFFFGDGGITAIGANCFNMAIVQVFVSYYIYNTIGGTTPRARRIAAAVAAYLALNISGLLAAIELGLQPMLAHAPDGTPLYAPYPLSITVPAVVGGHLLAGVAEAIITGGTIAFLHHSAPELLAVAEKTDPPLPRFWARMRLAWMVIVILIFLTPLGLLAPGTAWGEWSSTQLRDFGLGFVPRGMQRWENFWRATFVDYSIPGLGEQTGYAVSAVVGICLIVLGSYMFTFFWKEIRLAVMNRYRSYLEKNLFLLSQAIQESMFAEEAANRSGLLQKVDPRIKLIGFLLLILACSFSQDVAPILFLFLFSLLLVAGSALLSFSFFRRLWLFVPLYTALIALPALFLTQGDVVARIPFAGWTITEQGLRAAILLVARVTTTVSFLLLLVLTTRWPVLLKSLRWMGVPQLLVFMLAMTYRYIYVLLQTSSSLFLARQSRRVGPEAWRTAKEWMGTITGALLGRSYSMSSEIYLAMLSRGFRGEPVLLSNFRIQMTDWLWFTLFLVLAGVTFFWSYLA